MSDKRFDHIDQELGGLTARFDAIDQRFDGLDHRIGVLHEDLIGRIAGSSERKAVTEDQFFTAMAKLNETIDRRLDPLELVVREHSRDIAELKRTRQ